MALDHSGRPSEKRSDGWRINLETWIYAAYERLEYRLHALLGRRALTITLMALVLGLSNVDLAAIGSMAGALEKAMAVRNASFGLISTASTFAGAVLALPAGVLVDRKPRVVFLVVLTGLWSLGMLLSGLAQSYTGLLFAQILVGICGVSLGAVVASLTGDYFPPSQRGRVFGLIVSGEMVGAGLGMLLASLVVDAYSWRGAFWTLAAFGAICSVCAMKFLHEPRRGSMTAISRESIREQGPSRVPDSQRVPSLLDTRNISPRAGRIIATDPANWTWGRAVRYILSIPTNVILLAGSTAGYFYFNGLMAFAVLYMMQRYGLGTAQASLTVLITGTGAVLGVLIAGWLADRMLRVRIVAARVWVAAGAFFLAVAGFLPAFLLPELVPAGMFFFVAAMGLGATYPTLNAARLDIMHSRLWGRAESLRNALRYIPVAFSPYIVGLISEIFAPGAGSGPASQSNALAVTFLLMLLLLLISGIAVLFAALTYPRDVATAIASEHASVAKHNEADVHMS